METKTGTLIWCERAPYFTSNSVAEVASYIHGARPGSDITPGTEGFIFVDTCTRYGEPTGQQVMLGVRHISSVEPKTYE